MPRRGVQVKMPLAANLALRPLKLWRTKVAVSAPSFEDGRRVLPYCSFPIW